MQSSGGGQSAGRGLVERSIGRRSLRRFCGIGNPRFRQRKGTPEIASGHHLRGPLEYAETPCLEIVKGLR